MKPCVCDFDDHPRFTADWHRSHEQHHLAQFPDVDEGTKRNLADAVRWAELDHSCDVGCPLAACVDRRAVAGGSV